MGRQNVKQVYEKLKPEKLSPEEFIAELNKHINSTERMCRLRGPEDLFSPSAGRGLDALSRYLVKSRYNKKQYKEIMEFATGEELWWGYRNYVLPKLRE
jgi:hypothetical protein